MNSYNTNNNYNLTLLLKLAKLYPIKRVISIEKTNDRAVGAKTSAADLFF
jgi:hypothetical protein